MILTLHGIEGAEPPDAIRSGPGYSFSLDYGRRVLDLQGSTTNGDNDDS